MFLLKPDAGATGSLLLVELISHDLRFLMFTGFEEGN